MKVHIAHVWASENKKPLLKIFVYVEVKID